MSKNRLYLIIILIAASVITIYNTAMTYRNALNASEDSLRLQSIGIAVSLEASLSKGIKGKETLFRDIITEGKWEGIAFIALYDKNGTAILHSNDKLVGKRIDDDSIKKTVSTGETIYEKRRLGTGEIAFMINFPILIKGIDNISVLRIAIHTYPFEETLRQARLQIINVSVMLIIIWLMGYLFVRTVKRSEELKNIVEERERFAIIGEMSSVLAHEIRNPLGSIKGFAQYLKEQVSRDGKISSDYLDIIISESNRLETLTEDLLMYAKPSEIKREEFNVRELINEVIRGMNWPEDINIKTSLDEDLTITTDRAKLKQILINIIQNSIDAIKYNKNLERGFGLIEIKATKSTGKILITIKDNGVGMPQEIKGELFKPFFTTKAQGTGLGLSIVDRLIKSIGGKIEFESEPERGTVFEISMPEGK